MTVEEFISILSKSENKLLISEAKDLTKWKGLKHNKESLELFLNHCIAEVSFKTKNNKIKEVIVCSNTILIKMFSLKRNSEYKKNIKTLMDMKSEGIHTNSSISVLSWDFLKNKYCTIILKNWQIGHWIEISEDNMEILNETLRDILEKDKISKI